MWKGAAADTPTASVEVVVDYPAGKKPLRYEMGFTEEDKRFRVVHELVADAGARADADSGVYCRARDGEAVTYALATEFASGARDGDDFARLRVASGNIDRGASVLSQIKDPGRYPEMAYLGDAFDKIRVYREWAFGHYAAVRQMQRADLSGDHLDPDVNNPRVNNLGLVLNRMQGEAEIKSRLLESLGALYEGIDGFHVEILGGYTRVVFYEGRDKIPASRLSDGTLRYLCLLAILYDPDPGPLVCIEEPELGLHPDTLPTLADLITEASERAQLIVTTHSDVLLDAFHYTPEAVLVTEKTEDGTRLERLNAKDLDIWLDRYRLGELWSRGDIGGNRW